VNLSAYPRHYSEALASDSILLPYIIWLATYSGIDLPESCMGVIPFLTTIDWIFRAMLSTRFVGSASVGRLETRQLPILALLGLPVQSTCFTGYT